MNNEKVVAAEERDEVEKDFAEYIWIPAGKDRPAVRSKGEMITIVLILCACSCSMFEIWAEIETAPDNAQLAGLLVAKLVWLLVGVAAVCDIRAGRSIFAFLCGVSFLVIVSALPSVYVISKTIFIMLLVECLLKTSCLIALSGRYLPGNHHGPRTPLGVPETKNFYGLQSGAVAPEYLTVHIQPQKRSIGNRRIVQSVSPGQGSSDCMPNAGKISNRLISARKIAGLSVPQMDTNKLSGHVADIEINNG